MKLLSKIVWSEGMYLAPHHFQAQSRYFQDSIHFATASLWNESYGVVAIQLDTDALRSGTLALLHARGLFEDGLAFDMPESDSLPPPRAIAEAFSPTADHLNICLAIQRWSPDGQNCEAEAIDGANTRYVGDVRSLHDENTGRDEKPVRLGRKNIRLILESEAAEDLLTLPIARVVRDVSGRFALDPTFIPPCLKINASEQLFNMLRRLVDILEEKSAAVSQDQYTADKTFKANLSARHVAQFWFLHAINSSLSPLRHLLLSKQGHPEELFREMLRLGGALCTFGLDTHPRSLPNYDHLHLDQCFHQLDEHIRRLLEVVVPSQAIVIPLKQTNRYYYEEELKDERCFGTSRWILGVHSEVGEAELITRTQQLVKVCSARFVPELVKRALPGLTLIHLPVPPSAIAAKVQFQYFSISRSGQSGPGCWEHIMKTKSVGVYVPGELPSPELELIVTLEA
jgi:type VI secretion system protein ImpJ